MSSIVPVALMSNKTRNTIESGDEDPTLISAESPSSTTFLIDSNDRITGNSSEFIVDMGYSLMRGRFIQLKKVIVPKLPTVNVKNNTFTIRHQLGLAPGNLVTLPIGIYNTLSLSNSLTLAINTTLAAAAIADTVTTSFDSLSRTFSITSVGGFNFFIVDTSPFILYGKNLAPFQNEPIANVPSLSTIRTNICGMIYAKYLSVSSTALINFSVGDSVTSSYKQPADIVGIVDLVDLYEPQDYDPTAIFSGVYRAIEVKGAPKLKISNPGRSIPKQIDVKLTDSYGWSVNEIVQPGGIGFPSDSLGASSLGITLIFEVSY